MHTRNACVWLTIFLHKWFPFIFSGGEEGREYAGVGFVVAPRVISAVVGFIQRSNRLAELTLRVSGGYVRLLSVYAPQGGLLYDVRQAFFTDLSSCLLSKVHGPTIVLGDLNSRLHYRCAGEEDVMGPHVFGNPHAVLDPLSNRELLVQLCRTASMVIATSLFSHPQERLATYFDLNSAPSSMVSHRTHAQLDHVLVPGAWADSVHDVWVEPGVVLQSHHFVLMMNAEFQVQKENKACRRPRLDTSALAHIGVARAFASAFTEKCTSATHETNPPPTTVDNFANLVTDAFLSAARATLPVMGAVAHRQWISTWTLQLIDERAEARIAHDWDLERGLNKSIRASAREDRRTWLDKQCEKGEWCAVKRERAGFKTVPGRMRDLEGVLVSSDKRSETLADYYEKVQWRVPHVTCAPPRRNLGEEIPVELGPITLPEVVASIKRLRAGKAAGKDDVSPEFWKALLFSSEATQWALELCQLCWSTKSVPDLWHDARATAIFKKG